jgi:hypothetical protein
MVNLDAELAPPPVDGVRAFPDDVRPGTFYLVPVAPAIARDDAGRPELSFIVYGRKGADGFRGEGGILTLTTMLQVSRAQHDAAREAISERLASETGSGQSPSIEISPIDWVGGRVTVSLAEGVRLEGRPSLSGANNCALSANLKEPGAGALAQAWKDGLPDARIRYDMRIRTAGSADGSPLIVHGALGVKRDELPGIVS